MADSHAPETPATPDDAAIVKPPSKKKLIIIIVVVLLVISGIVGGLFAAGIIKMPGHKAATAESADAEKDGGDEKADEGKDGDKGKEGEKGKEGKEGEGKDAKKGAGGNFYEMPNMIVNLTGDNGKQRFLKISITLELNKKADSKAIEAVLPRVTDHFQTYLRELRLDDLRGSAGLYRLRQELLDRVHSASGVDVKDVLFEEILVQ